MVSELPFKEKKMLAGGDGMGYSGGKGTNGNRSALINIQTESRSCVSVSR